ncbi:hypothetical protein J5751_04955 [bacterium]|nr:hypothetical protein [bacterium]
MEAQKENQGKNVDYSQKVMTFSEQLKLKRQKEKHLTMEERIRKIREDKQRELEREQRKQDLKRDRHQRKEEARRLMKDYKKGRE